MLANKLNYGDTIGVVGVSNSLALNFPIVKCNDFGHKNVNSVIPIGGFCKIDCENEEVEIIEKFLK